MGRATAQVTSHRFPTTMARIRFPIKSCMVCGRQTDTGTALILVLQIHLPIFIPSTAPLSLIILSSALYIIIPILIVSVNNKLKKIKTKCAGKQTYREHVLCIANGMFFSGTSRIITDSGIFFLAGQFVIRSRRESPLLRHVSIYRIAL
jgi:hypothetical protein